MNRPGRKGPASGASRKTRQLCAQVARTIEAVLAGELDDEVLRELLVHRVDPAPDESNLLVTVGPCVPGLRLNPHEVQTHLHAASAHIRAEVAATITRRRVPGLTFQYAEPIQDESLGRTQPPETT